MYYRASRVLLWIGVLLLGTTSMLCADTAAGLQAFRKADYPAAYREWRAAADQGQAEAQYNLGILYLKGLGVARNPEEAFRWFLLAADQGQADAQFQAGLMREKGIGVQKDYGQAQVWFALAAERGDAEAEAALAELFEQGYGVQKDLARAVYWYKLAAEQGQAQAEFRLGFCYSAGRGVGKDLVKAYFWLTLASKQTIRMAKSCARNWLGSYRPTTSLRQSCPRRSGSQRQPTCRTRFVERFYRVGALIGSFRIARDRGRIAATRCAPPEFPRTPSTTTGSLP